MIIYATSKVFPRRTFVLTVKPTYTIGRVKAQLMHILFEMGKESHQFRLRFNGQYMKDSLTLHEYDIMDNAVFTMVPMAKDHESLLDLKSVSEESSEVDGGILFDSKAALLAEVSKLDLRQAMTSNFHALLYIHFVGVICSLVSAYWYTFFYHLPAYAICTYFAPRYSRQSGFTGNYTITPRVYCLLFAAFMFIITGASTAIATVEWKSIWDHGCPGWIFVDDCSYHSWYTAIFFSVHALIFVATCILLLVMYSNFLFLSGDYVEKVLVQTRDLSQILISAKSSRVKERRVAALELSSMASASDDNKFRIVAEPGVWDTLINLTLCNDSTTQEHATEALAELLTVPQIQNNFCEAGHMRHMTALLSSTSPLVVKEALTAISFIVQDNKSNQHYVITDHGLNDLTRAAYSSNIESQRILAGVFFELTDNREIIELLSSMNTPAQALIRLCTNGDPETQAFSLQSLDFLARECPDTILAQNELVPALLALPFQTEEAQLLTLAAKLLLYFTEQPEMREDLISQPSLKESLVRFGKLPIPVLQRIAVKIVASLSEQRALRIQALSLGLDQVLEMIKSNSADREAWTAADTALDIMNGTDELAHIPSLTAEDKVSIMREGGATGSLRGSRVSLQASRASITSRGSRH